MFSYFSGKCTSKTRLDGKVAVITGANTGIGKVTAKDFLLRGAKVIIACRDLKKAEDAVTDIRAATKSILNVGSIHVVKMDLASLASVRIAAQDIMENESRIDILVNNAGVMWCPYEKTVDGFERHFGVNHLGHFLFTCLLLPKIISSAPARIVIVSSMVHSYGSIDLIDLNWETTPYSTVGAYSRSKLANILFTKELSKKLKGTGVNVYSLHPGVINSELQRHMDVTFFRGSQFLFKYLVGWFGKNVQQGAQTTIYCSVDDQVAEETGYYYSDCKKKMPSAKARDGEMAEKLWMKSWNLVKLGNFDPFSKK